MTSTTEPDARDEQAPQPIRLSDLYSANFRANHPEAMKLAGEMAIPHPLNNVQYADGISPCRHAKRHTRWQRCEQEVRKG